MHNIGNPYGERMGRATPRSLLLRLTRQLGEIVNVSATYLGIAVLVIAASGALLQPVRDPLHQAWEALLQTSGLTAEGTPFPGLARFTRDDANWQATPDAALTDATQPGATVVLQDLRRDFNRFLDDNPDALATTGATSAQFQNLRRYLSRRYRVAQNVAGGLIQTAFVLGQSQGVDPQLLLAIIAIESRYNPFAESHVGAQGLMQVMPRVHRDKFEALGLDISAAVESVPNLIVGTQIYTDCRRRRGSVAGALACYVGATGPGDGGYGAKVLAERRRIARASGIASPQAD